MSTLQRSMLRLWQLRESGFEQSTTDFLLHIIPKTFTDAFTGSRLSCKSYYSGVFGYAMMRKGETGRRYICHRRSFPHLFGMMNVIMKLAPVGAGAAMAFTIGKYGIASPNHSLH